MSSGECDFLLVAALHSEFQPAVRKVFGATREPKQTEDTHNYYRAEVKTEFGREYDVRLVCVGRKGGQSTAALVTTAVKKRRPMYVIMFGIAAVQPGDGRDIGHLLISDSIVDFEEAKKGKKDEPRGKQFHCEGTFVGHVNEHFKGRPGEETIHVGIIISQPNLSRNKQYRESLVQQTRAFTGEKTKVIGLEMEGGGLAKAILDLPPTIRPGFIVFKAAVDWGNYHKNDNSQKKSILKVAQFTREFLESDPVAPVREMPVSRIPSTVVTDQPNIRKPTEINLRVNLGEDFRAVGGVGSLEPLVDQLIENSRKGVPIELDFDIPGYRDLNERIAQLESSVPVTGPGEEILQLRKKRRASYLVWDQPVGQILKEIVELVMRNWYRDYRRRLFSANEIAVCLNSCFSVFSHRREFPSGTSFDVFHQDGGWSCKVYLNADELDELVKRMKVPNEAYLMANFGLDLFDLSRQVILEQALSGMVAEYLRIKYMHGKPPDEFEYFNLSKWKVGVA